ncbi:helix-turn-helix domain-containing protein [Paenibacillus sp. KS-LC4]|uniref:helix-turn-helix domain-containing protein n=1 Tax=Paenibacillus sp. KS-LC4 TaxID=2979727 RepID=UPI0030CCC084
MNPITYELLGASLLADSGTTSPSVLTFKAFPAIIIPSEAIIVGSESHAYPVEKGQAILLRHAESKPHIRRSDGKPFEPVYGISFNSYRMAERGNSRLIYELYNEQLPEHGQLLEFPRQAAGLLDEIIKVVKLTASIQNTPKLHLMLHQLLDVLFARDLYSNHYLKKDKPIHQVLAYMKQHYRSPLSRSYLAKMAGFNESYFSSLFRKETGWSFAEYVYRIRIDEAKRLLLLTNDKMQEIAYKTGFADGSYLGKTFQKIAHLSPSSFRSRKHATRIVGMQFVGALLAVGIQPLAAPREVLRSSSLLRDYLPGIVELADIEQVEELRTLAPELIIAPTYHYNMPYMLKALEQVAPVIMLPWGEMDKLEEVRMIGKLLGRTAEAENWIARLQQQGAAAKQRLEQHFSSEDTFGLYELRYEDSWMILHPPVRAAFILYKLLGLKPPAAIQREIIEANSHLALQEQHLLPYTAKHMFLIVSADDTEAFRNKLMGRSFWQQLVNEQGSKIYLLKLHEFWMDDGVSLEKQLDIMVELLLAESAAGATTDE